MFLVVLYFVLEYTINIYYELLSMSFVLLMLWFATTDFMDSKNVYVTSENF